MTNIIDLHIYKKYKETFPSRTKIFKHIYINTCDKQATKAPLAPTSLDVIEAELREHNTANDYITYTYMKLITRFLLSQLEKSCYVDISYTRLVVGENQLKDYTEVIYDDSQKTSFKGITSESTLTRHAMFPIYVTGKLDREERLGKIFVIIQVMTQLDPGLLLGIEFLQRTSSIINYRNSILTIRVYKDLVVDIIVIDYFPKINRNILVVRKVIVLPNLIVLVPINCKLILANRIYFFEGYYIGV